MANHKITEDVRKALKMAVDDCGSIAELSRRVGVQPHYLSRYLSGTVKAIQTDIWLKLCKYIPEIDDRPVILKSDSADMQFQYSSNAVENFRRAALDAIMDLPELDPEAKFIVYQCIKKL